MPHRLVFCLKSFEFDSMCVVLNCFVGQVVDGAAKLTFLQLPPLQNNGSARAMPEPDRETLWESLCEKQVAQLDRLKRGESKYSE